MANNTNNSFHLGPYTVQIGLRPDNPAFPTYLVFRGEQLVGKQFSRPCLSDCEWLERTRGQIYATVSRWPEFSEDRPIWNTDTPRKRGRPRKIKFGRGEDELKEILAT